MIPRLPVRVRRGLRLGQRVRFLTAPVAHRAAQCSRASPARSYQRPPAQVGNVERR